MQQLYDAKRINIRREPANITLGSNILIEFPIRYQKKFSPKRIGLYKVVKKLNDEIVVTDWQMPGVLKNFTNHANNIRVVP